MIGKSSTHGWLSTAMSNECQMTGGYLSSFWGHWKKVAESGRQVWYGMIVAKAMGLVWMIWWYDMVWHCNVMSVPSSKLTKWKSRGFPETILEMIYMDFPVVGWRIMPLWTKLKMVTMLSHWQTANSISTPQLREKLCSENHKIRVPSYTVDKGTLKIKMKQ